MEGDSLTLSHVNAPSRPCPNCGTQMNQRLRRGSVDAPKRGGWVCAPCNAERSRVHRAEKPDKALDTKLWSYYRIRLVDYQRMLNEQGHACAACGVHVSELNGNHAWGTLTVDHDHSCCESRPVCGKCVRGLICSRCNLALGHTRDDIDHLEKLISYVRKWQ